MATENVAENASGPHSADRRSIAKWLSTQRAQREAKMTRRSFLRRSTQYDNSTWG